VRGRPLIIYVNNTPQQKVTVEGDMFNYITGDGLYLSGSTEFNTQFLDLYSKVKNVSAFYQPFSGTPVDFIVLNNNTLQFTIPPNILPGNYDIIFCNPAGYAKASNTTFFRGLSVVGVITNQVVEGVASINGNNSIISINGSKIVPINFQNI
jgi:hypothetical protein